MTMTAGRYRKYSTILRKISAVALVFAVISLLFLLGSDGVIRDIVNQSSDGRPYSNIQLDFRKMDSGSIAFWTFIISAATLALTAAAAISTGLLAWRKDGREQREAELVRQKLALEIDRLKGRSEGPEADAPSE